MPKATKLSAQTVKVAERVLLVELSSHTIAVLPFPFPLRNIYCFPFGITTFSLKQQPQRMFVIAHLLHSDESMKTQRLVDEITLPVDARPDMDDDPIWVIHGDRINGGLHRLEFLGRTHKDGPIGFDLGSDQGAIDDVFALARENSCEHGTKEEKEDGSNSRRHRHLSPQVKDSPINIGRRKKRRRN